MARYYREALAAANKLSRHDKDRLISALTEYRIASLDVCWSAPVTLAEARSWPQIAGVYAILLENEYGYFNVVRIGATHDASRLPGNYNPRPFTEEPRLRLVFAGIPDEFRKQMAELLADGSPREREVVNWLEHPMQHRLLEAYHHEWDRLPIANFRPPSFEPNLPHINIHESGALELIELFPATVSESVLLGIRRSVM